MERSTALPPGEEKKGKQQRRVSIFSHKSLLKEENEPSPKGDWGKKVISNLKKKLTKAPNPTNGKSIPLPQSSERNEVLALSVFQSELLRCLEEEKIQENVKRNFSCSLD